MKKIIYLMLVACLPYAGAVAQCNIAFDEGVSKHLITPDLFAAAINYHDFICPKFFQGDSTQCGQIVDSNDAEDVHLPDGLIFSAFFNPAQYAIIKPVLKDPFFQSVMAKVPLPSAQAMAWYNDRKNGTEFIIPLEDDTVKDLGLDDIQKKMVTLFYNVQSWTFCPETPVASNGGLVRGRFDTLSRKLVIYKDACLTDNVYKLDVSASALAFRLFFVTSHEMGHVADYASGKLAEIYTTEAEERANVFGLILTEAFAKLINIRLVAFQKSVHAYKDALPCDKSFIDQTVNTWTKMDQYFVGRIDEAKGILKQHTGYAKISTKQKNWSVYACLQSTSK